MQQPELLQTKLYMPPTRPELVSRRRLIERLNEGLGQDQGAARKLTLVSATAGLGKTALVSEWVANLRLEAMGRAALPIAAARLSLDERDSDPHTPSDLPRRSSADDLGPAALCRHYWRRVAGSPAIPRGCRGKHAAANRVDPDGPAP